MATDGGSGTDKPHICLRPTLHREQETKRDGERAREEDRKGEILHSPTLSTQAPNFPGESPKHPTKPFTISSHDSPKAVCITVAGHGATNYLVSLCFLKAYAISHTPYHFLAQETFVPPVQCCPIICSLRSTVIQSIILR